MTPQRLRRLHAFHLVMRTGSVTQAAEALSISQPAVSKLLQALEAETHLVLFDRSRRRLLPTPQATRLHLEVERLFRTATGIDHLANELRAAGPGELRIAALPLLGARTMPLWLATFARRHPGLRTSLEIRSSRQIARSIAAGEIDLGFALALSGALGVGRHPFMEIPAVIVLPRGHRLASRPSLVPRDLEGESFVSLGREDEARDLVDSLFESHRVKRKISIETNVSSAACALVAGGAGVALVDALTPALYSAEVVALPIQPTVRFKIEMLTMVGRPPSALIDKFTAFIAERLAVPGSPWLVSPSG
ncbi:LysR family transcriptional regulator [Rhodovastum atsumiense]|uniref:LysR family transcriptional regulator n=1 Tax=Rhodovastum atsumiense TaxID=504468 RepID=A0A5M6IPZ9_9PROT|nr:LysR substrate-binding domain-containing protein [Rhodovastum atsumiense]KAA5609979.1 LysR family transcriptional regulator [Rhodovastum atsumiense]CAH2598619.1 LysR family transcriptional regulator [Rhodovastum atsumiense]